MLLDPTPTWRSTRVIVAWFGCCLRCCCHWSKLMLVLVLLVLYNSVAGIVQWCWPLTRKQKRMRLVLWSTPRRSLALPLFLPASLSPPFSFLSLPKVLLHEMAAQKYATFLAESKSHSQHRPGANGHGNLNLLPLSYYRRPRRKRQASFGRTAVVAFVVRFS